MDLQETGCHFPEQLKSVYNEWSTRLQTGRDLPHELRCDGQRKQSHKFICSKLQVLMCMQAASQVGTSVQPALVTNNSILLI